MWLGAALAFAAGKTCLAGTRPGENRPKSIPSSDKSDGALRFGTTPHPSRYRTRTAWPPPHQHQDPKCWNKVRHDGLSTEIYVAVARRRPKSRGVPGRNAADKSEDYVETQAVKLRSLRYGRPSLHGERHRQWLHEPPKMTSTEVPHTPRFAGAGAYAQVSYYPVAEGPRPIECVPLAENGP
jgi:hypothetical protein